MVPLEQARDIGNGLVCASFGAGGEWLSLATIDPVLGFVELTGMPPFDEAWRGDPAAVRRYRAWMGDAEHAFLVVDAGAAAVTSVQEAAAGTHEIHQRVVIRVSSGYPPPGIRLRFRGRLARPAYAEITEVDPPRWPTAPIRLEVHDGSLVVLGEGAPVAVQARSPGAVGRASGVSWTLLPGPGAAAEGFVGWPAGANELRIDIACSFDLPAPVRPAWAGTEGLSAAREDRPGGTGPTLRMPARLFDSAERISRRALDYVRGCTALEVRGAERCILADHRILPLSWTRDAYWQVRLLLSACAHDSRPDDAAIVADHLRWLFLRCERPDGRWVRSHFADGTRKDRPFQADQQLYPLLELTDHVEATGSPPDLPPGRRWPELVTGAWTAVEAAIDDLTGLIGADENPADDVLSHPFLLSNQVLLWRTATRLAASAGVLGMSAAAFSEVAARTKASVGKHFVVDGPLGRQWAYAVDARDGAELYHDANDLPAALAPLWGFCAPHDPVWRRTMRFALHPANPAFVAGACGGLGSRHTPGSWTLGDIQHWVVAGLTGDETGAGAALDRLVEVAGSNDWMLPEAYTARGSGEAVRRWFAWPGAAFGWLFLEHARTEG